VPLLFSFFTIVMWVKRISAPISVYPFTRYLCVLPYGNKIIGAFHDWCKNIWSKLQDTGAATQVIFDFTYYRADRSIVVDRFCSSNTRTFHATFSYSTSSTVVCIFFLYVSRVLQYYTYSLDFLMQPCTSH